jgi:O-antigen/teichoic acid export membrane protein
MLLVLAIISFPRPISGVVAAYLQVKHKQTAVTVSDVVCLVLLMAALLTVGRLGPLWACGAVGVVFMVRLPMNAWMLHHYEQIPARRFLMPLLGPMSCALPLIAAVLGARAGLRRLGLDQIVVLRLVAEVLAGAIGYGAGAAMFARAPLRELVSLLKTGLRRAT